jgi:hypothetical protein
VGQGHIGAVSAVAFGSCAGAGGKGRVLVSGGADKLVKVKRTPFLTTAQNPFLFEAPINNLAVRFNEHIHFLLWEL